MLYKTATDFRKSLEARLKTLSIKSNEDLQRLRRKVAFDRLLARIFSEENTGFFLKGGYAMELRCIDARATRDMDLTSVNDLNSILEQLDFLSRKNLYDHFVYTIGKASRDLDNAPYGGFRYPVTALIDNRLFVQFHLDIGIDIIVDRVESVKSPDWLKYCNVPTPTIWMISAQQQFCEKVHAYTLPRGERPNSRVKDLVDMSLLLSLYSFNPQEFLPILSRVFHARKTHDLPKTLSPPPKEWELPFSSMIQECGLSLTMQESFEQIKTFYDSLHGLQVPQGIRR